RHRAVGNALRLDAAAAAAESGLRPGGVLGAFRRNPRGCDRAGHLFHGRRHHPARDAALRARRESTEQTEITENTEKRGWKPQPFPSIPLFPFVPRSL